MRLLLTRAAEDAARTREKLEAGGHHVVVSSVIEVVGTGASWPAGVADAILATSGQAFGVPVDGLSPDVRRIMPLYLVGQRTAEAAQRHDFLGPATVAPNATSLAIAMEKAGVRVPRIVYLAGRDRKPDIETALEVVGQRLDVVEIYEARAVERLSPEAEKGLKLHTLDGVLHFSRRSADLFVATSKKAGLDIARPAHFCLSEDVAAPLREADCATIVIAAAPNEASLFACLPTPV